MAITLYSGTPGSGKSYHSIQSILRYLASGKPVICNFPMKFTPREVKKGYAERFIYVETLDITVNLLLEYRKKFIEKKWIKPEKESEILCMFDECSILFNPREFSRKDRMEWIIFFSTHRHYGFEVVLISQMDRMVDRQIRGLIENEIKHRKLNNLQFPFWLFPLEILFKLFCLITGISFFMAITYWYPVKMKIEVRPFIFRRSVAKHYSTYFDFRNMESGVVSGGHGGPTNQTA